MKAQIISETIPASRSFMPSYYQNRRYGFMWHYHPNFELFVQKMGNVNCIVGDYIGDLYERDIILVGANLPHSFYTIDGLADSEYEF